MKRVNLRDLCQNIQYGYTASATAVGSGPRFLRITDIRESILDWETTPFVDISESDERKYALQDGDLVIARTGAFTGWNTIITSPPRSVFASYLIRIQVKKNVNPFFIHYFLQSPAYSEHIESILGGSAQPNASAVALTDVEVDLPSLNVQNQIADVLRSFDNKIQANAACCRTLEEMSQALFKSWFVDFDPAVAKSEGRKPFGMSDDIAALFPDSFEESELGAVPKGWRVEPFSAVAAKIETGGTPSRQNAAYWNNGAIDWYKTGELFDGPLLGAEEKISEEGLRSSNCKLWEKDTILFALYASPTLGRMGILESPGTANQACAALTAGQDYGQQFLFHSLLTARGELQSISSGAAQQNINLRILREHRTIVPPPTLAVAFESICSVLYQRRRSLSAENQVLAKARDALLPELLGGRIAEATNVTEATAA